MKAPVRTAHGKPARLNKAEQPRAEIAAWKAALVPDHETLRALLLEGRSRAHTGLVIEDFGYTVALWNRAPVSVGLGATVGSYPATVGLGNSFRLGLPPAAGDGGELYEPAVARSIMLALVDSWDPDFATWQSMELYNAQNREALWNPQVWTSREPKIGWLTYLASSEQGTADKAARVNAVKVRTLGRPEGVSAAPHGG
jgi:hypothetical protein